MSSAASKQKTHKYVDISVTQFSFIKNSKSLFNELLETKTSPEPSAHATDANITYKRKTDLKQILTFV